MTEQQIKELKGLISEKAKKLQEQYGKNELVAEKRKLVSKKFSCHYFIMDKNLWQTNSFKINLR